MISIDYVAWWGAAVATLVLIWDMAKWFRSGPRIKAQTRLNIVYPDARVIKTEKIENDDEYRELASYCHIEVTNVGVTPTTIMEITARYRRRPGLPEISTTTQGFEPHYGKILPQVIGPGEIWSCRLEMARLYNLAEWGKPYLQVTVSHRTKPIMIRLPMRRSGNCP